MPTLLVAIPHPDDESYAFGGLIAAAARAGWAVHVLAATSGEGGERHDGRPLDRGSLGRDREAELARSCAILGAEPPHCLRLPDGDLGGERDRLGDAVSARVSRLKPDAVSGLGSDGAYGHPDHIVLSEVLATVCGEAGVPLLTASFEPGLFVPQHAKCVAVGVVDPRAVPAASLGEAAPDFRFDITAVAGSKLASIAAHATQLPGGDPHALFPPGIIAALLREERYRVSDGRSGRGRLTTLLSGLQEPLGPLRALAPGSGQDRAQATPPTSG